MSRRRSAPTRVVTAASLPLGLRKQLERAADAKGTTMSALMREATEKFLAEQNAEKAGAR